MKNSITRQANVWGMRTRFLFFTASILFVSAFTICSFGAEREAVIEKAVAFLRESQAEDGSFSSHSGVGPTGVVLAGLLEVGVKTDDPVVGKALAYLEKSVQPDGGVYLEGSPVGNYETCVAMMCFKKANDQIKAEKKIEKGPYDALLAKNEKYVRSNQYTEENGRSPSDLFYGGAGYGRKMRPDLSNTQFFVESLRTVGAKEDDPAIQKALIFVSRCQNLETPHNTTLFSAKNQDGGFVYTCVGQGESPAGTTVEGGLRSYGSMTYAGLKSMIYAGVGPEDPRVKAAYEWIRKNYSLEENPGLGKSGLYYYYQTLSKTLSVMKRDEFETNDGKKHPWKKDLLELLAAKQQPDGSWVNDATRWMEGDPHLVTGYVLMVLGDLDSRK